jgi:predicted TIM-barrel fold metal-dependent hydrolase
MTYAGDRVIHDADSHIMDDPRDVLAFCEDRFRPRLEQYAGPIDERRRRAIAAAAARREDADHVARDAEEIMLRKTFSALGATDRTQRPRALDLLGFRSQLVFNTFGGGYLLDNEYGDDLDYAYGVARAVNRYKLEFCSVDPRLLPVCYVPLADFDRTLRFAEETLAAGAKALLIPSACPKHHSPSHTGLFPFYELAERSGVPLLFHVGGQGRDYFNPTYFQNGFPVLKDWLGGDENFRSVSYMAIPNAPMQTIATLIFDGVFERFPKLRFGVIEMGASWVPSFLRYMDSAHEAFMRHEERLQALTMPPSRYFQRQVRVTPFPAEDVGWIMRNGGADVLMFASDYPHVEGGRNPIKRFETSLAENPREHLDSFYHANMVDLMGNGLRGIA